MGEKSVQRCYQSREKFDQHYVNQNVDLAMLKKNMSMIENNPGATCQARLVWSVMLSKNEIVTRLSRLWIKMVCNCDGGAVEVVFSAKNHRLHFAGDRLLWRWKKDGVR